MPRINNVLRQDMLCDFVIIFSKQRTKGRGVMTVYADVLFLINFIFNSETLILLCKIYSKKIPKIRLFVSAILGGVISVFAFIPYLEFFARTPASFILPAIMILLVFYPVKYIDFFGRYLSFLAISFMLSGAVIFFGLGTLSAILLPLPIYFAICILRKNVKKKKGNVILEYDGKKIEVEGFFDSGNMLLSGGLPVILGNGRVFRKLFGCEFSNKNIHSLSEKFEMRIVPYISLGKTGTVFGVKLNRIWVDGKEYNDIVLAYAGDKFLDDLVLNSALM